MVVVIISKSLESKVNNKFKGESVSIFSLMYSLEENPKKGKILSSVGKLAIGEIKYKKFRFFFITDGVKLKLFFTKEIDELIIKFVKMSGKKDQQKTINEIKILLKSLGEEGFGV